MALRILIADDHALMRDAVRSYLSAFGDDVSAADYFEVLNGPKGTGGWSEGFDLILLDLMMPGMPEGGSSECVARVRAAHPAAKVVVFSGNYDASTVTEALRAGARGFIPKTTRGKSLVNALQLVLDGETYVPPVVVQTASPPPPGAMGESAAAESAALSLLTDRERACLSLLAAGMRNKEIARELGVQEVTVKMYLRSTFRKLGTANRIQAVRIALAHGLGAGGSIGPSA